MEKLYRKTLLLLTIILALPCLAQNKLEFNVLDFHIDQFSTTAQDKRYEKFDSDGERYAIIKVKDADGEDDLKGFIYNFGNLKHEEKLHEDELWVYVQRNAKTVTIKRSGYKTIERYDLRTTIQPGKTYVMILTMAHIRQEVVHNINKQVLQFIVTPANENATVKVKRVDKDSDYQPWGAVDETGSIDKLLEFGTYDYEIQAKDYNVFSGRVTLSTDAAKYIERVTLKPNFGFLDIEATNAISGAQIIVDDEMIGTVPYKNADRRFTCGSHKLTITNGELYKPYETTFTIEQGETTHIALPLLESDFAKTTIIVDIDAEIFIDGKRVGNKKWKGPLKAGRHVITCQKTNHKESSTVINVKADAAETFTVPAPAPITGSLYVRSTPSGAKIFIDGEEKGVTPMILPNVLIGSHRVTLSLANYNEESAIVTINEGKTEKLDRKLSDVARMVINSVPSGSRISINGREEGITPFTRMMLSGDYNIELQYEKYKTYNKKVHLDSSNPERTIKLKRQFLQPNSFYIQPYLQVGSMKSFGVAVGGYISNVNIEAYYSAGTEESEMIYWNSEIIRISSGEKYIPIFKSIGYTYKASIYGGRFGYGLILGTRMRIIPQIGIGVVRIHSAETGDEGETYYQATPFDASQTYAMSVTMGGKLELTMLNHLGLFIAPEYSATIKKGKVFNAMLEVSNKLNNFVSGLNVHIGLNIFFN